MDLPITTPTMLFFDFVWFVVVAGLSAPFMIGGYRLVQFLTKRRRARRTQEQAWALLIDVLMAEIEQTLNAPTHHLSKRRDQR